MHIVHTTSQRNHKFKPQVSTTGKERIEETTSLIYTEVKPRSRATPGTDVLTSYPGWLSFSCISPCHPTLLSWAGNTAAGVRTGRSYRSCSPTVRNINALAPSLLVPNFCPDAGCHLLAHHIETSTYIHWDLLLKLKSDSRTHKPREMFQFER